MCIRDSVGGHKGFPTFLDQYHLADSFQTAHLGDEVLHDDQRHHRQQHLVAADVVQLTDLEYQIVVWIVIGDCPTQDGLSCFILGGR